MLLNLRSPLPPEEQNYTIIVNWRRRGFGCTRVCSYCNWRDNPLLPHGPIDTHRAVEFAEKCQKSFVTVSGGGDPLYRLDENLPHLLGVRDAIRSLGKQTRMITREVDGVVALGSAFDSYSISLDGEVMQTAMKRRDELSKLNVEYSLVLPPLPTCELVKLKPQYEAMLRKLGRRLILRENLNSIFPVDFEQMSFGHRSIAFVSKHTCLGSRYLAKKTCVGYDLMTDMEHFASHVRNDPKLLVFGGYAKHIVDPARHMEYSDIDLIATSPAAMQRLTDWFGYSFAETTLGDRYPRYFRGTSIRSGPVLQVVLVDDHDDAIRFVKNAQYDVDRLAFFMGDMVVGDASTVEAVKGKVATLVRDERDLSLFSPDRPAIESKHKLKLARKGFTIIERN